MAQATDYYREADLKKFTRIGVVVVVVVALAGWFFYRHASDEVRVDNRDAIGARTELAPGPQPRPGADSVEDRIQNWNRNQASDPVRPPAR